MWWFFRWLDEVIFSKNEIETVLDLSHMTLGANENATFMKKVHSVARGKTRFDRITLGGNTERSKLSFLRSLLGISCYWMQNCNENLAIDSKAFVLIILVFYPQRTAVWNLLSGVCAVFTLLYWCEKTTHTYRMFCEIMWHHLAWYCIVNYITVLPRLTNWIRS